MTLLAQTSQPSPAFQNALDPGHRHPVPEPRYYGLVFALICLGMIAVYRLQRGRTA